VAITSVRQGYEYIEGRYDYKTETETTYEEQELLMDIGKSKENFKDIKSRYFNCNSYGHMIKDCQKLKKEKDNRKCYKYEQVGHIAKDCRTGQKMKNQNVQENIETDTEEKNKKKGFREYSK